MESSSTVYSYRELYTELEDYERNGICMLMDGGKVSPLQIVTAHMIQEEGSYMRDYIIDPEGYIKSLVFVNINEDNQAENPLILPDSPYL
ncbi:hypothetical protein HGO97_011980 [Faecalicatena sp. AGMB00832]|uniref:Uncharacterized protein n=1 Tax=Faecalicatena faecalis TaxID=2726362 RepID=A0ABS6D4Z7_9FIRM|nr:MULTISPECIES: hypothetical protein [Faecalicatena]MBU3876531.1 hypothetical protein [Faecalicatena faecalis]MCI6467375.1 hypothetical protein [Faecalicatena sp.]MDY5621029.1 hypothetical protein [Lachnospiraceae bacterium]